MNGFIKLTDHDGYTIHINKSMVLTIESHFSNGSKIKMAMNDSIIKVKESPDEVVKKLNSIQTINYDNRGND